MKCVLIAFALASIIAALANGRLDVEIYPQMNCTGSPRIIPIAQHQCQTQPNGTYFASNMFGDVVTLVFAKVYLNAGPNCENHNESGTIPCDTCINSKKEGVGYFRYNCHRTIQRVHAEDQCNSDCTTCARSAKVDVGQCLAYSHGSRNIFLRAIVTTTAVNQQIWPVNRNCTGFSVKDPQECNVCNGQTMFKCSHSTHRQ